MGHLTRVQPLPKSITAPCCQCVCVVYVLSHYKRSVSVFCEAVGNVCYCCQGIWGHLSYIVTLHLPMDFSHALPKKCLRPAYLWGWWWWDPVRGDFESTFLSLEDGVQWLMGLGIKLGSALGPVCCVYGYEYDAASKGLSLSKTKYAGAMSNCCCFNAHSIYNIQPCTSLQCQFI